MARTSLATSGRKVNPQMEFSMRFHTVRHALITVLLTSLCACALLPQRDPPQVTVVGVEPLPGQELEVRFAVKLRLQNPIDRDIDYNGVALNLEVNGRPLASGVSDQEGHIGRYSEGIISVPVSVSAFSFLRQTLGLSQTQSIDRLPYRVSGKLAGGLFGTARFSDSGTLDLSPLNSTW